jgi:hypothetical protein
VDAAVNPTGRTQTIDGLKCDEYSFTTSMDISNMGGAQMPPEVAAAMQGMRIVMQGSLWVTKDAPGVDEYRAYQRAMASAELVGAAIGATGATMPGMDKLAKAMTSVDGLPVLTEMNMNMEGGTGPQAEMMRQAMSGMKVVTKILSVKTDTIADDVFAVPTDYQVIK